MGDEYKWLRTKKVLQVKDHVVSSSEGTFWCYSIKYLDDIPQKKKGAVDYREILDEESFKRYASMRTIRKQLADAEGVPAYTIFTNEELAALGGCPT